MLALFLVLGLPWIGCSVLAYGYLYSAFQNEDVRIAETCEPYDAGAAATFAILGPFTLFIALFSNYENGPRFRRYKYISGVRQP